MAAKTPVYCVYNSYRHSPLALGMIVSYAQSYKDGMLNEHYEFVPQLLSSETIAEEQAAKYGPGIFLFSNYLWSSAENLRLAKLVKEWQPASSTILGGPHVPKYDYACEEFLQKHPYADIAVRGEGEVTTAELLEHFISARLSQDSAAVTGGLQAVTGITFRHGDRILRTPDRPRLEDLNALPSPYLSGCFNEDEAENWVSAIVETNRGCPYGCTFCDWGSATLAKIRQFSMDRVERELEWIADRRISVLWIADANFGIFERDVAVAKKIVALRQERGYPQQVVVNYAKNATDRLAAIVGVFHAGGIATEGIIAIQTQDEQTLRNIDRSNIKTKRYEELISIFRSKNLPIASDIMIGLPGATVESFKADLQFFFDRNVFTKAYSTVVLPNSPMAQRDYLKKYGIQVDKNGQIISTASYSPLDRWTMGAIYLFYRVLIGYSVLKYLLYLLQLDYGIPAMTFIGDLQLRCDKEPRSMTKMVELIESSTSGWNRKIYRWKEKDWAMFHKEIANFLQSAYNIPMDEPIRTMLKVQAALMPRENKLLPQTLYLTHDVAAYFEAIQSRPSVSELPAGSLKKLSEYPPRAFEVHDPLGLCDGALDDKVLYDQHHIHWELSSPLSSSSHHFVTTSS